MPCLSFLFSILKPNLQFCKLRLSKCSNLKKLSSFMWSWKIISCYKNEQKWMQFKTCRVFDSFNIYKHSISIQRLSIICAEYPTAHGKQLRSPLLMKHWSGFICFTCSHNLSCWDHFPPATHWNVAFCPTFTSTFWRRRKWGAFPNKNTNFLPG